MKRYPNKFVGKQPEKIPKDANLNDSDTGLLYKWDGKKPVLARRQKRRDKWLNN